MKQPPEFTTRLNLKLEELSRTWNAGIVDLLRQANKSRLKGKGKVTPQPLIERNNLRWSLEWKEGKISFDLNVVVNVEDDGKQAQVSRVWVHRHASSSLDFEGHTPTTRMRRLTGLSLEEIQQAVEAELK